jgi:hypothetical protein
VFGEYAQREVCFGPICFGTGVHPEKNIATISDIVAMQ